MRRLGTGSKSLTSHSSVLATCRGGRSELVRLRLSVYPRFYLSCVHFTGEGRKIPVNFYRCDTSVYQADWKEVRGAGPPRGPAQST